MEQDFQTPKSTIGTVLTDARSQAGLSQADVAKRMNLMARTIQALEEDDFQNLPGPTYVRGYLHTYARLVGLDSEQLIRIYNEQFPIESPVKSSTRPSSRRSSAVLWGGAALAALLGMVVLFQIVEFQPGVQAPGSADVPQVTGPVSTDTTEVPESGLTVEEEPSANEPAAVAVEPQAPVASIEDSTTQRTVTEEPVDDSGGSTPAAASVQAVSEQPVALGPPVSGENLEVFVASFLADSWIEVRDADGKLLLWDLIRSGAMIEISGKGPFEVLLGNSPDVVIRVDGQPFDHSRYHQSDRTSRFKVPGSLHN